MILLEDVALFVNAMSYVEHVEKQAKFLRLLANLAAAILWVMTALSMKYTGLLGVFVGYALSRFILDSVYRIVSLAFHYQTMALQDVGVSRFIMVRSAKLSHAIIRHGDLSTISPSLPYLVARAMKRSGLGQIYDLRPRHHLQLRCSVAGGRYFLCCKVELRLKQDLSKHDLEQISNFIWLQNGYDMMAEIATSARRRLQREMLSCGSVDYDEVLRHARSLPKQLEIANLPYTAKLVGRIRLEKTKIGNA